MIRKGLIFEFVNVIGTCMLLPSSLGKNSLIPHFNKVLTPFQKYFVLSLAKTDSVVLEKMKMLKFTTMTH